MVLELSKLRSTGVSIVAPIVSSLWDHHSSKSAKQRISFPTSASDGMHRAAQAGQSSKDSTQKDTSYFGAESGGWTVKRQIWNNLWPCPEQDGCVTLKEREALWNKPKHAPVCSNIQGNTMMRAWLYSQINVSNLYMYVWFHCAELQTPTQTDLDPKAGAPCTYWQRRRRWL